MFAGSRRAPWRIALLLTIAACARQAVLSPSAATTSGVSGTPSLKDAFAGAFLVGGAVNVSHFTGRDSVGEAIIRSQFNTITSENVLKWESVHPEAGRYDFSLADRYVEFGARNGLVTMGHTLVWHQQTPRWVFTKVDGQPVSRDTLVARLRDHIHTVVGRYKGRIKGWDVVNEAVDEDGTLRRTPWLEIIGPDYIGMAFRFAHEADPDVELYYNDYSLENAPKRNGTVSLMRQLQQQGVRINGVGLQGHHKMDWPSVEQQDSTIGAFADLGLSVMITELDVDLLPRATRDLGAEVSMRAAGSAFMNPYAAGLPDSLQMALARRYADIFGVLMKHRKSITRVTFWGVRDGDSWLNDWPVRGRTSYPLLFDRAGAPKPAFFSVIQRALAPIM